MGLLCYGLFVLGMQLKRKEVKKYLYERQNKREVRFFYRAILKFDRNDFFLFCPVFSAATACKEFS